MVFVRPVLVLAVVLFGGGGRGLLQGYQVFDGGGLRRVRSGRGGGGAESTTLARANRGRADLIVTLSFKLGWKTTNRTDEKTGAGREGR